MSQATTDASATGEQPQPKKSRVRRHKKHHGGHHGGAWKVAYADFITTMMALFLLLWLLNSTSEDQQKALAQYFRDPGIFKTKRSNTMVDGMTPMGQPSQSAGMPTKEKSSEKTVKEKGDEAAEIDTMTASVNASLRTGDGRLTGYVKVSRTATGMRITLINGPDDYLFEPGTARPTKELNRFLAQVGEGMALINDVRISITGHTDATPISRSDGYGNFDLSVDRALTCKRILRKTGVLEERFVFVEGVGPNKPAMQDPLDPRNQRVTIDVEWSMAVE